MDQFHERNTPLSTGNDTTGENDKQTNSVLHSVEQSRECERENNGMDM